MKRIICIAVAAVMLFCCGFCVNAESAATKTVIEAVVVTVGEDSKTVEVNVQSDDGGLVAYFSDIAVTECNDTMTFTYVATEDEKLNIRVIGDTSASETAVCDLGRFTDVGKYVQYVNSDVCDVNGDGISNLKDLVRTNKIIAEVADFDLAADFGGDGDVTVLDLVTAAKVLVSKKAGMPLYTVTYAQKNGNVLQTKLVAQGFGTLPDVSAQKDGYEFTGWSAVATNVTKDMKIYANYYPEDIYTEWPEGFA